MNEHEIRKAVAESQWSTYDRAWFMQALVNLLDEIDRLRAQLSDAQFMRGVAEVGMSAAPDVREMEALINTWPLDEEPHNDFERGENHMLLRMKNALSKLRSAKPEGRME